MAGRRVIEVRKEGERDWVVRELGGREFGHYVSQGEAEAVGAKLARTRGAKMVTDDGNGKPRSFHPRKSWLARIFGR